MCHRGCAEGRVGSTRCLVVVPGVAVALSGPRGGQGGRTHLLVVLSRSCSCTVGAARRLAGWPHSSPEGSHGVAHMRQRQLFKEAGGVDHSYGLGHLAEWMDWIGFFCNRCWTRLDMA